MVLSPSDVTLRNAWTAQVTFSYIHMIDTYTAIHSQLPQPAPVLAS